MYSPGPAPKYIVHSVRNISEIEDYINAQAKLGYLLHSLQAHNSGMLIITVRQTSA